MLLTKSVETRASNFWAKFLRPFAVVTHARSVAMTAAGTAAAMLPARAASPGRSVAAVPGKHQECPLDRQSPRYPTLAPSSHVREIRAPGPGCRHEQCPPAAAG